MASNQERKSCPIFKSPKTTLRDAAIEDLPGVETHIRYSATKFFGSSDMIRRFRSSSYSLIIEHENKKLCAYANFRNSPNLRSVSDDCWLSWLQYFYHVPKITYGNTLFMTFFIFDDPYDIHILSDLYREVFLREPKIKFICVVCPPVDSIYEDVLEVHCKQIFSTDEAVSRLCQSLFVCERYSIIPKMRIRRALSEDNDDLIEIIDEKLPSVRAELGDYYIAEQVMRNDPTETIVVAEIANATIGMMWINTNLHRKALAENFEIGVYGNLVKPGLGPDNTETRTVIDIYRKRSDMFFDKTRSEAFQNEIKRDSEDNRLSLSNLYICSYDSVLTDDSDDENNPKTMFERWDRISRNLKATRNYRDEFRKSVKLPKSNEVTNAFAIQLFGLTKSIDPRRLFDMIAGAFASYPDRDYCMISLSSGESSSDSLSGPLLRYFSRVVPRPGCKISDCLYITHRNSFLSEIEVSHLTYEDIINIEHIMCLTEFSITAMYFVADVMQRMMENLENPWTQHDVLVLRSSGVTIGFAILKQNTRMMELRTNYMIYDTSDAFMDWNACELMYLHLHPAFVWEWVHVMREIFRVTGYYSMFYTLTREYNQPVMNNILMNMFPIFPRKRTYKTDFAPYALYQLTLKMSHMKRDQIENKIVLVGFNEVCKGFLRSLIFSPNAKHIQCLNLTVVTESPGFIEAEYDIKSFEKQDSLFFSAKNQFDADYLRKLEFRTWVTFIGGRLKGIKGEKKRVVLENGTTIRYDRLFLMCSSRYSSPKQLKAIPPNYLELNSRLDKIIFYNKIRLLVTEDNNKDLPIIIYGTVVLAHSCVSILIELGIKPSRICFFIPRMRGHIDFPEIFDDEYIMNYIYKAERRAGVKMYKNLKFIDWVMHPTNYTIESVVFESDFERISVKCLAFISFHGQAFLPKLRETVEANGVKTMNRKILIDQFCKTNQPFVYAAGRITQYHPELFAAQVEQKYFNQIEIGNQLAMNFINERRTGVETNMVDITFIKPIFRQSQLIDGLYYAGLRKPGRYVPREIRKSLQGYGVELITQDNKGEYCRVCLDKHGFVTEITCLTRKYTNLEVIYRIYGLHETMLNNMKIRCMNNEIGNLLDFFHQSAFSVILHDQFPVLKERMRKKNLECLKEFLKDKDKIDRREIQTYLKDKGMHEVMQKEIILFITKHWKSLHPQYALPSDYLPN